MTTANGTSPQDIHQSATHPQEHYDCSTRPKTQSFYLILTQAKTKKTAVSFLIIAKEHIPPQDTHKLQGKNNA